MFVTAFESNVLPFHLVNTQYLYWFSKCPIFLVIDVCTENLVARKNRDQVY